MSQAANSEVEALERERARLDALLANDPNWRLLQDIELGRNPEQFAGVDDVGEIVRSLKTVLSLNRYYLARCKVAEAIAILSQVRDGGLATPSPPSTTGLTETIARARRSGLADRIVLINEQSAPVLDNKQARAAANPTSTQEPVAAADPRASVSKQRSAEPLRSETSTQPSLEADRARQHRVPAQSIAATRPKEPLWPEHQRLPPAAIADRLEFISGIDSERKAALAKLGITRFAAIAAWTATDVARVGEALGCREAIARENWIEQAAVLATGRMTHHVRRVSIGLLDALAKAPRGDEGEPGDLWSLSRRKDTVAETVADTDRSAEQMTRASNPAASIAPLASVDAPLLAGTAAPAPGAEAAASTFVTLAARAAAQTLAIPLPAPTAPAPAATTPVKEISASADLAPAVTSATGSSIAPASAPADHDPMQPKTDAAERPTITPQEGSRAEPTPAGGPERGNRASIFAAFSRIPPAAPEAAASNAPRTDTLPTPQGRIGAGAPIAPSALPNSPVLPPRTPAAPPPATGSVDPPRASTAAPEPRPDSMLDRLARLEQELADFDATEAKPARIGGSSGPRASSPPQGPTTSGHAQKRQSNRWIEEEEFPELKVDEAELVIVKRATPPDKPPRTEVTDRAVIVNRMRRAFEPPIVADQYAGYRSEIEEASVEIVKRPAAPPEPPESSTKKP